MKRKVLVVIILLISLFININYANCLDITDNNKNTDIKGGTGTGGASISNGISGNEMQGIKVSVYRANGEMVPGTTPKYIILKDGEYASTNFCSCTNNRYDFSNTSKDNSCSCTTTSNVTFNKTSITGDISYWGLYFSSPTALTTLLTKNDNSNIYEILDLLGYNKNGVYDYKLGDYLIVEPLVTVSCETYNSNRYVTGTINALIKSNFSFLNGQQCGVYETRKEVEVTHCRSVNPMTGECVIKDKSIQTQIDKLPQTSQFSWYYSAIGQSFKTRDKSCSAGSSNHGITMLNQNDYSGCGYNKFDLNQIITTPCSKVSSQDGTIKYYDINNKSVSEKEYISSCGCRETNEFGQIVYYGVNATKVSKTDYDKACRKTLTCAERVTNNPVERINLYNEYRQASDSTDYRNLLDFSKSGASACTKGSEYTLNSSCLTIKSSDKFDANNLSKYTYTTDINGKLAYCNSDFSLESNAGTVFPTVNSGMAYVGGNGVQSTLATGTLTLTCYLYSNNITQNEKNADPFNNVSYNQFISGVTFGDRNLDVNVTANNTSKSSTGNYVKYSKTYTAKYMLPKVYINKITGELVDTKSDNTIENYGLYSKFSDNGVIPVSFNVSFGKEMKMVNNIKNGECKYTAKPEIVVGDLNLEFRTIDTSNPFTGSNGKGRKVGANWCSFVNDTWDCSNTNSLVKSVISNRNNSYNKNNTTPKYKFVLTPTTISKIKDYNSSVKIDEYRTKCGDGICRNTFFETIKDSIIIGKNLLIK